MSINEGMQTYSPRKFAVLPVYGSRIVRQTYNISTFQPDPVTRRHIHAGESASSHSALRSFNPPPLLKRNMTTRSGVETIRVQMVKIEYPRSFCAITPVRFDGFDGKLRLPDVQSLEVFLLIPMVNNRCTAYCRS